MILHYIFAKWDIFFFHGLTDLAVYFRLGQSLDLLKIFFLLYSVFLVIMAPFLLFIKAACCSPVCKNCITYVLVIKQEIAERERGLEKTCGAKWTFYISRVLLSKISRLRICLSDASVWRYVWLCIGVWLMYNGTESIQQFLHCPAICVFKKKRRKTVNLSLWVSSHAPGYLTVLENQGMTLQSWRMCRSGPPCWGISFSFIIMGFNSQQWGACDPSLLTYEAGHN